MASLKKRGKTYYAQYYVNGKQKRVNLNTDCLQFAKDKLRQIESAQLRQEDIPLPTKSPIGEIVQKYLFHLGAKTSEKNVQKVATYLRSTFGPVCESLKIKNEKIAAKAVKRPASEKFALIEVSSLEQLTTEQVSAFLSRLVVHKGISAKTVNHYRQTLLTMCNWAMREGGVKFPGGKNPVEAVKRYREAKNDIRYLKRREIDEQLSALAGNPVLQVMVALYIFAGLRREEALWLMPEDFDWEGGNYGVIRIRAKSFNGKTWMPKTKINRTVPISSELRPYLDRYRESRESGTWFFSTLEGCKWDPDNFSGFLRAANETAGLSWTCLDFRHTFGSHLASKGESLYKIAKVMGNSPQICEKHYAALMPESLYQSVEFGVRASGPVPDPPAPTQAILELKQRPRLQLVVNNR